MEVCASVRFKAHRGVYIDVTRAMLHDARPSIEKYEKAHLSANVPHSQQLRESSPTYRRRYGLLSSGSCVICALGGSVEQRKERAAGVRMYR